MSTAVPTIIGPEEFQTMKTLHSTLCEPLYAETVSEEFRSTIEPYLINPQKTYKLISKAPKCITPGIDGFRNEQKRALADKFQNPAELLFVNLYSQLLTSIANATIPHSIPNLLGGAELIALKQGVKKRLIALGYSIRKDATSYITQSESTKQMIVNHLSPIQTSIGIPNGAEKIINQVATSLQSDNTLYTLQSDYQPTKEHYQTPIHLYLY